MTIIKKSVVILASAARTANPSAVTITDQILNPSGIPVTLNNLHFIIDVTAVTATPSVLFAIEAEDPVSGEFYSLLSTPAAITATGTTVLRIGKDIESVTNLSQQDFIPKTLRFTATHGDADSITYSVGMNYEGEKNQ